MRQFRFVFGLLLLVAIAGWQGIAAAEEIWTVRSGVTSVYFNRELMRDLKLDLTEIKSTAAFPEEMEFRLEEPRWSFAMTEESNLRFQVEHGIALPYGVIDGAILHQAEITLTDPVSGRTQSLAGLQIAYVPRMVDGPGGPHPTDALVLRDPETGEAVFELEHSMFDFRPEENVLWIHYMNMRITDEWAARMDRPDLAGWTIGMAEIEAQAERTGGPGSEGEPYVPNFIGTVDVSLGLLNSISQVGHTGTWPDGVAGLSMATTSCNLGDTDVPWLAPMAEDHPVIAMALYRELDGRLEQLGVSWMKHGFYALSNNDCSQCQHPSNGTFLGVGCSDTYGVVNNGDRNYLGPRSEINPFTARWTCRASHFSGGIDDCVRRHGSNGHNGVEHRLTARDADLDVPGATYFYEADYLVRDDQNLDNNIGHRRCTMRWNESVWQFTTPSDGNPLTEGPVINGYGEMRAEGSVDESDGNFIVAVQTDDLGGGLYSYEYAVFNRYSDLGAHSFSLPVGDAVITSIGFHDSDDLPSNDWEVSLESGRITWSTANYESDPGANALGFGLLFNFRFVADRPPTDSEAALTLFKPHTPRSLSLATRGPAAAADVAGRDNVSPIRLDACRPNPLGPDTRIGFALASPGAATLEVFDLQGRRVRVLMEGMMPAGGHEVVWDGKNGEGRMVESGVYYYRLRAGRAMAVKSVVVLN